MGKRQNIGIVRGKRITVACWVFFLMLLGESNAVLAAENKARVGVDVADIMTVVMGLVLVLLIIFGCAWLVRKIGVGSPATTGQIKVLAILPVGSRERITLIEVGGKQLLVGVTANQINTLYSFDEPIVDVSQIKNNSEFAQKLHQLVSRNS